MSLNGSDLRRIILVSAIGFSLVLIAAAPAHAAIRIKRIAFDPAGRDSGTRAHINEEFIMIKNTGSRRKSLAGWRVHDKRRDHTYRFTDLILRPDEYVRLHSGRGKDSGTTGCNGHCFSYYDFYWGLANYVWNNTGDVGTLRNRAGKVVDRCRYGSSASSPKRC